jgi:hypothetical protein
MIRRVRVVLACGAVLLTGAAAACTPEPWDTVGGVAQLPPEVQTLLLNGGDVADPGEVFSAGDFNPQNLPMRGLKLAVVGSDCVRADVEQGGRGIQRISNLYQLIDGHWKQVGKASLLPTAAPICFGRKAWVAPAVHGAFLGGVARDLLSACDR